MFPGRRPADVRRIPRPDAPARLAGTSPPEAEGRSTNECDPIRLLAFRPGIPSTSRHQVEASPAMSQLFEKKPLSMLLREMGGETRLKRVLGPVGLTAVGVGAIIGTGIFVLIGEGAHDKAGPALMLSF